MKAELKFKGKVYTITFDDDLVLDTVERDGVYLVSTHHVVKRILANADKIARGFIPTGFERV